MIIKYKQAAPPVFDQSILSSDLRRMRAKSLKTRAQAQLYALQKGLIFDERSVKVFGRDVKQNKFVLYELDKEFVEQATQVGYTRDGNRIMPLYKELSIVGTVAYLEREIPEFVNDSTIETYKDDGIYFLQGTKVFFIGNVSKVITDIANHEVTQYPYRMGIASWGTLIK